MRRWLLALLLLAGLPAWGEPPNLTFTDLDGRPVALSELIRRSPTGVVVLTVWCSRCNSCRRAEPELDRLARDLHDQALVVGVDASAADTPENIREFQSYFKFHFPVLLDPPGGLVDSFHIQQTTSTLIFDRQGALVYFGRFGSAKERCASQAAREAVAGRPVSMPTTELRGCPILRSVP